MPLGVVYVIRNAGSAIDLQWLIAHYVMYCYNCCYCYCWYCYYRLIVYEAFYLITVRDIKGAAALLLDCVATFTCTELCTYEQFIFYAVSYTSYIMIHVLCKVDRTE